MTMQQEIINAFYSTKTGLTKNIAMLKERNPDLIGVSNATIREVLNRYIPTYNANRAKKKIKDYVKYSTTYPGQILHADLMFIKSPRNTKQSILVQNNSGQYNQYILIIVDTYSKFLWAYPIKNKSSQIIADYIHGVIDFLTQIFYSGNENIFFKVLTDAGNEFSSRLIDTDNVKHIISKNPRGAALAEGAIYKIRIKIRYMDRDKRKLTYSELMSILDNVNSESEANDIIFGTKTLKPRPGFNKLDMEQKFNQGDYVRVVREKSVFEKKSALHNYSKSIFIILDDEFNIDNGIFRYRLGSIDGRLMSNLKFYEAQLEKVPYNYIISLDKEEMEKLTEFSEDDKKLYLLTE